jgi:hypothetical protein
LLAGGEDREEEEEGVAVLEAVDGGSDSGEDGEEARKGAWKGYGTIRK